MYMYPIIINKNPKIISYSREVDLGVDYNLNFAKLRKLGITEDEKFTIYETQDPSNGIHYKMTISGLRFETDKELKLRVAKEEKYMENYTNYHANKTKK